MMQLSIDRTERHLLAVLTANECILRSWEITANGKSLYLRIYTKMPHHPEERERKADMRYKHNIKHVRVGEEGIHIHFDNGESGMLTSDAAKTAFMINELTYYLGFENRYRRFDAYTHYTGILPTIDTDLRIVGENKDVSTPIDTARDMLDAPYNCVAIHIDGTKVKFIPAFSNRVMLDSREAVTVIDDRYIVEHILSVQYSPSRHTYYIYFGVDFPHKIQFYEEVGDTFVVAHHELSGTTVYGERYFDFDGFLAEDHHGVVPYAIQNPFHQFKIAICPVACSFARGI